MVFRLITLLVLTGFLYANSVFAQDHSAADIRFKNAVAEFDANRFDLSKELFQNLINDYCGLEEFGETCINSRIYLTRILRIDLETTAAYQLLKETDELIKNEYDENPDFTVHVYLNKIYIKSIETQLEEADVYVKKLTEILEKEELQSISKAMAGLGFGFYEDARGNYSTAIESYLKGLSALEGGEHTLKERKLIVTGLTNLGVAYRKSGKFDKAMETNIEAVDLAYNVYGENHLTLSYIYNNIGSVYYSTGDFGQAAEYFERGAAIISQSLGWNNERIGTVWNNAGVSMFRLGNFQKAAEYLEEAQRVKEANFGENHIDTALGYSNLASIYILNGAFDQAERNYQRSIDVRKANLGSNHPDLIDPKMYLAALYNDLNRFEESRLLLERALVIAAERLGEHHPKVSELHHTLGNNFRQQNLFREAIDQYGQAIERLYGDFSISDSFDVEREFSDPSGLVFILRSKAEVYRKLYDEHQKLADLQNAKRLYGWAIDLVDFLQRSYHSEASKLNLLETNYSIYTESVDILEQLYREDADPEYLEKIFELMEKSRSRVALELLNDLSARTFGGLPDSVLEEERELNADITRLLRSLEEERQKGEEADEVNIAQLSDSLFYARRKIERFSAELEQSYPSYHQLKFDQQVVSVQQTISLLDEETTLLSYMIGDASLYLMILSTDGLEIKNLGSPKGLEEEVMNLRSAVTGGRTDEFTMYSYRLFERLLKPVIELIESNSLLILADHALHYLPFEMLLTKPAENHHYHRMPFMVRQFDISYAPSATVYSMMQQRKQDNPRNFLALAPFSDRVADYEDSDNTERYTGSLEPLLLTAYETREIGNIFRQRQNLNEYLFPNRTSILRNSEATKNGLLQNLDDYNFIHFATHAFVNEESPEFSGIALYPDGEDGGMTYVSDIYNIQMNADLVVLGACETGLGSVHRGEGMIGFTRAFIYAGTANLAVSMWRVNDQPTATMMIKFYSAIREGNSYSSSLRKAKLSMIENPETAAPRNWAAFVLHGR